MLRVGVTSVVKAQIKIFDDPLHALILVQVQINIFDNPLHVLILVLDPDSPNQERSEPFDQ